MEPETTSPLDTFQQDLLERMELLETEEEYQRFLHTVLPNAWLLRTSGFTGLPGTVHPHGSSLQLYTDVRFEEEAVKWCNPLMEALLARPSLPPIVLLRLQERACFPFIRLFGGYLGANPSVVFWHATQDPAWVKLLTYYYGHEGSVRHDNALSIAEVMTMDYARANGRRAAFDAMVAIARDWLARYHPDTPPLPDPPSGSNSPVFYEAMQPWLDQLVDWHDGLAGEDEGIVPRAEFWATLLGSMVRSGHRFDNWEQGKAAWYDLEQIGGSILRPHIDESVDEFFKALPRYIEFVHVVARHTGQPVPPHPLSALEEIIGVKP